jgi:uncharacterized coiled-coil protein SlyX
MNTTTLKEIQELHTELLKKKSTYDHTIVLNICMWGTKEKDIKEDNVIPLRCSISQLFNVKQHTTCKFEVEPGSTKDRVNKGCHILAVDMTVNAIQQYIKNHLTISFMHTRRNLNIILNYIGPFNNKDVRNQVQKRLNDIFDQSDVYDHSDMFFCVHRSSCGNKLTKPFKLIKFYTQFFLPENKDIDQIHEAQSQYCIDSDIRNHDFLCNILNHYNTPLRLQRLHDELNVKGIDTYQWLYEQNTNDINTLYKSYKANRANIEDIVHQHRIKIDEQEVKINHLEVKIDEQEVKINHLEVKINEQEVKINEQEVKINHLEVKINEQEVKTEDQQQQICILEQRICILEQQLNIKEI